MIASRIQCDYCNFTSDHKNDFKKLYSGKLECWRCQFYYVDKSGKYAIKNRWFVGKHSKIAKFIDDGTGHYIPNPEFKK